MVWAMKVEDGSYTGNIVLPDYEYRLSGLGDDASVHRGIYSFLGVANGGKLFFYGPQEGGYVLLILEKESSIRRHGFISVDEDELYYSSFSLSSTGIISALLASEYAVRLVWWRSSGLFAETAP